MPGAPQGIGECAVAAAGALIPRATRGGLRLVRLDIIVEAKRERDASARGVQLEHLDAYDIARLDHRARVLDECLGHGRDVHQSVLMHTMSTNAPNAATLVTTPSSTMPGLR